jgi:hypothetical protein
VIKKCAYLKLKELGRLIATFRVKSKISMPIPFYEVTFEVTFRKK